MTRCGFCVTVLVGLTLMTGCGQSDHNSKRQAAIVEQALPSTMADSPTRVDLPKWGVRNPHVHVRERNGKVEVYSTDHGWNGKHVDIYYVPNANVDIKNGDYTLHSNNSLQKVATTKLKPNGTWLASWDLKGNELPDTFYLLARTNIGQATIEKVISSPKGVIDGGVASPVQ